VPSSTSSSDDRLPSVAWFPVLVSAVLIFLAFVTALEALLAARGFRPTVQDSESGWFRQRDRASALGSRALILIGASRIQLDLDLDVLRARTGLEPVQLAINGSSSMAVLQDLASDPTIRGAVLIDYYDGTVVGAEEGDAVRYESDYAKRGKRVPNGNRLEEWLTGELHTLLRSYADGASPLDSLRLRALNPDATPPYLITRPDRSRLADYTQVKMPDFRYARAVRNIGSGMELRRGASNEERKQAIERRIAELAPLDNSAFTSQIKAVGELVASLRKRGIRVIFVRLPESGYVLQADDKRYPRTSYWDLFTAQIGAPAVNFADIPVLKRFECPDGSHLDYRDRRAFTEALLANLDLGKAQ